MQINRLKIINMVAAFAAVYIITVPSAYALDLVLTSENDRRLVEEEIIAAVEARDANIPYRNMFKKTDRQLDKYADGGEYVIQGIKNARTIQASLNADGSFKNTLPKLITDIDIIGDKRLPSPKNKKKVLGDYAKHAQAISELYSLGLAWRLAPDKFKSVPRQVYRALDYYMSYSIPERAHWRLMFRFKGLLQEPNKSRVNLLPLLDKMVIALHGSYQGINDPTLKAQWNHLALEILSYTDQMLNSNVGAQNRGVNWAERYDHLITHYVAKYLYGDRNALLALKHHLYDGSEYDPNRLIEKGMGPLPDGGFTHHGQQAYVYPYGGIYMSRTSALIKRLEGTSIAFKSKHYAVLEKIVLDSYQHVFFNNEWIDLSIVGGKQVVQPTKAKAPKKDALLMFVKGLLKLEHNKLTRLDELQALAAKLEKNIINSPHQINKNFWNWEYMVHRRQNWYLGFKALSTRSQTPERRPNYFLNSGFSAVMQSGDEYWNIRPAMDWFALPGVTNEHYEREKLKEFGKLSLLDEFSGVGSSDFSNGTSNGKTGLYTFESVATPTALYSVSAKKSAFFFEQGGVYLTNSIEKINAGSHSDVWTTINQTERKGVITYGQIGDKAVQVKSKEHFESELTLNKLTWIHHDNVGYLVLPETNSNATLLLSSKRLRGNAVKNYSKYYKKGKYKTYDHRVMLMAINHGKQPIADKAIYAIFPGINLKEFLATLSSHSLNVLANNDRIMAVSDDANRVAQLSVSKHASVLVPWLGNVSVSGPAVIQLSEIDNVLHINASDPYQSASDLALTLEVDGRFIGDNASWDEETNKTELYLKLNTGKKSSDRGLSHHFNFKRYSF